jgi:predicted lactoylglutathione lyase
MVRKTPLSIMFDSTHRNLLTFEDSDLHAFKAFIETLGFQILENNSDFTSMQEINLTKILVIGVPTKLFSKEEIQNIIDYVRNGGSLLLVQSHGGDALQHSNLNELAAYFGLKFENTVIKSNVNAGVPTLPIISITSKHDLLKGVRKLVLGGACSLTVMKNVEILVESNSDCVFEEYNPESQQWEPIDFPGSVQPLAAVNYYGLGKVAALSSLEMFSANPQFGLDSLDNRRFIANIITWLGSVNSDEEVKFWILDQIGLINTRLDALEIQMSEIINNFRTINERVQNIIDKKQ